MNPQVCHNLLERLTYELHRSEVRDYLERSLSACEVRDWKSMSELAQNARMIALKLDDGAGEAVALLHLGIAFGLMDRNDLAKNSCLWAKRIFKRNTNWRHRLLGEGLAAYALGLIHDSSLDAAKYYREALNLVREQKNDYAAKGDKSKQSDTQKICDELWLQVSGQFPIIYVEGKAYRLMSPEGRNEKLPELKLNVEYLVIPVEDDAYDEFGLSPNDSVLVRRTRQVDETESGLGVWYTDDGEYMLGRFERDVQGNVRLNPPSGEKLLGASNVGFTGRVDAILKPA